MHPLYVPVKECVEWVKECVEWAVRYLKEFEKKEIKKNIYALVEKEFKKDKWKDMEFPTPIQDIF